MGFSRVTDGWGTATQTTAALGSFSLGNTGGWQTYNWVPLKDASGSLANVALSGTNTLRVSDGGVNYNFFILTPPLRLFTAVSAGNLVLYFGTQPGFNYTVQWKTDLTAAAWTALSTVAGDGTTKSLSDPMTGARRFYRLQVH